MFEELFWSTLVVGFVAGSLVGSTGVGGTSFATPALVLVLGVPAPVAIATNAVVSAIIKLFGIGAHRASFAGDRTPLKRALYGSIPGAILGAAIVSRIGSMESGDAALRKILGIVIILGAGVTLARALFASDGRNLLPGWTLSPLSFVAGLCMGLTSIGAGSLFIPLFSLTLRASLVTVVATSIAQGLILSLVVGAAHSSMGTLDTTLLVALTAGGIPGVFVGAKLHKYVSSKLLVSGTASVIAWAGLKLVL